MAAGRNEGQTAGGVLSVSIEGNIGAGKSSLLPLVSDREGPLPSGSVETHPEPLEKWQRVGDDGHSNLLAAFYDDPSRWSYTFQSFVFITRFEQHHQAKQNASSPLLLLERSVFTDRHVFGRIAIEDGLMNGLERGVYNTWFEDVVSALPNLIPDAFIYLRTDPSVCFERLKERARSEEAGVPFSYLKRLHDAHEHWFIHGSTPARLTDDGTVIPCSSAESPTEVGNVWLALMDESKCHSLLRGKVAFILEGSTQLTVERRPEMASGLQDLLLQMMNARSQQVMAPA